MLPSLAPPTVSPLSLVFILPCRANQDVDSFLRERPRGRQPAQLLDGESVCVCRCVSTDRRQGSLQSERPQQARLSSCISMSPRTALNLNEKLVKKRCIFLLYFGKVLEYCFFMPKTVMESQLVSPQWSVMSLQPVQSITRKSQRQKDASASPGKLLSQLLAAVG